MTRRTLLGLLPGAWGCPAPERSSRAVERGQQSYRADAVIRILSIPVYSRPGVGSGCAWWEEAEREGARRIALGFGAGSWPGRARGLNRLGCIEEWVLEQEPGIVEAGYFGFMTASPEESLDEAKRSLEKGGGESIIVATQVLMRAGGSRTRKLMMRVESDLSWANLDRLIARVRRALGAAAGAGEVTTGSGEPPFLYALRQAVCGGERRIETAFSYQGRRRLFTGEIREDAETGERLRRKGAVGEGCRVLVLEGSIRSSPREKVSRFRLWFDGANPRPLPLRIEFAARSFLHLVFEADSTVETRHLPEMLASARGWGRQAY